MWIEKKRNQGFPAHPSVGSLLIVLPKNKSWIFNSWLNGSWTHSSKSWCCTRVGGPWSKVGKRRGQDLQPQAGRPRGRSWRALYHYAVRRDRLVNKIVQYVWLNKIHMMDRSLTHTTLDQKPWSKKCGIRSLTHGHCIFESTRFQATA